MHHTLERLGWGSDALEASAPVAAELVQRTRALAFWLFLQARGGRLLGLAIEARFQRPNDDLIGAEAALVRLISLLERLHVRELPALVRAVRTETVHTQTWMREPRGGRVDAGASLRAHGGAPPESWLVQRIERKIETPVNLFATAVLRAAADRIAHIDAMYRRCSLQVPEIVHAAHLGLHRFLRDHPLGSIELPDGASPEPYRRAAGRRAAELARIHSLVQWWHELQNIEIVELRELFADDGKPLATLSIHAAYEMVVALGLLCALADVLRFVPGDPAAGLRFVGYAGEAVLHLGAPDPTGAVGRGPTAALTLSSGSGSRSLLVDARHCSPAAAKHHAFALDTTCRLAACDGLLIVPGPVGALHSSLGVRWLEMPATLDVPALVRQWRAAITPYIAHL